MVKNLGGQRLVFDRQPEQPGDVPQTWAYVAHANELFGYRPTTSFKQGVAKFYEWWCDGRLCCKSHLSGFQ